jgi:hypothetical protein
VGTVDVLIVADVNESAVTKQAASLANRGSTCEPVVLDITDAAAVHDLATRARSLGALRSVAHVAGVSPTMGDWRRIIDIDLVATARLVDALRPLATSGTAIVCFASMAAHLNAQQTNAAADAAIDEPLAEDLFDAYAAALGDSAQDPGMAYSWAKRGVQRLVRREAFGFGRPTEIELPGESPGILPLPNAWGRIHLVTASFGQGFAVTPLQLASAYAAIGQALAVVAVVPAFGLGAVIGGSAAGSTGLIAGLVTGTTLTGPLAPVLAPAAGIVGGVGGAITGGATAGAATAAAAG